MPQAYLPQAEPSRGAVAPPPAFELSQMRNVWFGILLMVKSLAVTFLGVLLLLDGSKYEIPWYSALPAFLVAPILFWLGWLSFPATTRPQQPGA